MTPLRASIAATALLGVVACNRSESPSPPSSEGSAESASAALVVPPASARTDIPELRVPRLDGPAVDGELGEGEYPDAAWTDAFVSPGDGQPVPSSPVRARAAVGWTPFALHIAFVVADADATSDNDRFAVDPHIWEAASGVELMLQPGDPGDNTAYYEVQVDVAEAVWDTRFIDYNRPIVGEGSARQFGMQGWSAVLRRKAVVSEDGYVIEMALPWAAINSPRTAVPPEPGDVWRANLYSFRDGQRHALAWSPIMGEGNFHFAPRFGRFVFEGGDADGSGE